MMLFKLFIVFFEIGAVSFGGGYGMISLIRETVISNSWLTEEEFLNFIAVSESTPGPLAVNIATFVGASQAGFIGSLAATLGVILPSFIIILLIAALLKNLLKYPIVNASLDGIRPCIAALVTGTGATMIFSSLFNFSFSQFSLNFTSVILFCLLPALYFIYKKIFKKAPSPIILLLFSAIFGGIFM